MDPDEMTPKQHILASLMKLPDDATYEDAIEWIYVLKKIERGIQDIKEGRTLTNEEVQARMAHWLQ